MFHLDTNVAIARLDARSECMRDTFDAARAEGSPLVVSSIVLHEPMFGAAASARRKGNEDKITMLVSGIEILPFDAEGAGHAGDIRALWKPAGTPIGPRDVPIAAQARRHRATLVTANGREVERVPGLTVIDWAA